MTAAGTAIITGGSSGLGLACVQQFARLGFQVASCDLAQSNPEQSLPDNVSSFTVDVTQTESIQACLQTLVDQNWPTITVLINCAGISLGERVVGREGAMPLEHFTQVVNVNLVGTFNMCRLVAEVMSQQGQPGVIINTASIAAFEGQLGQAAYSASKGGIASMTLPMAREFKQFGIRVVTIAPGLMTTPMTANMTDNVRDTLLAHCQYPARFGEAEEFAKLAAHIVDNDYLNGCTLRLDGAVRLS